MEWIMNIIISKRKGKKYPKEKLQVLDKIQIYLKMVFKLRNIQP